MSLNTKLLYIEVQHLQFNPDDQSITMKAHWSQLPDNVPANFPVYMDFQANAFQLLNMTSSKVTTLITDNVESFFSNYYYTISKDANGELTLLSFAR